MIWVSSSPLVLQKNYYAVVILFVSNTLSAQYSFRGLFAIFSAFISMGETFQCRAFGMDALNPLPKLARGWYRLQRRERPELEPTQELHSIQSVL